MADPDQVRMQLQGAGYETISFERIDAPVLVGSTPDDAVDFQLALAPAGEIYRQAGEAGESSTARRKRRSRTPSHRPR